MAWREKERDGATFHLDVYNFLFSSSPPSLSLSLSLLLRVPTDCPIDLCSAENRAQREAQYVEHDAHAAPVRAKRSHLEDESDPSAEKSKRETSSSCSLTRSIYCWKHFSNAFTKHYCYNLVRSSPHHFFVPPLTSLEYLLARNSIFESVTGDN